MSGTDVEQARAGAMGSQTTTACDIAVIIPCYRQPGFLPEALDSVLGQRTSLRVAAIIVDDGCPMAETREVGLAFAARHPGRVFYLRRRNGGLSAARNTGIDFALAAFPGCRAVYFLDADNRLHPGFLQRAWGVLQAAPAEVGWAYPDIDMFGFGMNFSVRGAYSHFVHLVENYCEAGSLVRRAVFERGLRFDEAMRQGFEDWEFWLSCADAGFIGRHVPQSGFQYRRRAESMLTGSERQRQALLTYMRTKHRAAMRPAALLALEGRELPRFAIVTGKDAAQWRLTVDPRAGHGRVVPPDAAARAFADAAAAPRSHHFPGFACCGEESVLAALEAARLLPGLFWMAQGMLETRQVVMVELEASQGTIGLAPLPDGAQRGGEAGRAALILISLRCLEDVARDRGSDWLASIDSATPGPRTGRLRALLPPELMPPPGHAQALPALLATAARLRAELAGRSPLPVEWREDARQPRPLMAGQYAGLLETGPLLPCLRPEPPGEGGKEGRDIGLILPLFTFGGVEKVVLNYARVMRQAGWRPHLFITGAPTAQLDAAQRAVFESVNFLPGWGEGSDWNDTFLGAGTSTLPLQPEMREALGLLCTMDAVLNTHAMAGHGLAAGLRRLGVKTFLGLHLVERSTLGQPMGNPHIALAYEHAYDGFLVISRQLRDWCLAQAVPRDKLHLVPNAPSYDTAPEVVAAAMAERAARQGPLRILFLGRLDAQKGLDRLEALIPRTRPLGAEWRVVGRAVLDGMASETAEGMASEMPAGMAAPVLEGIAIEPPVAAPAALDALYRWADILVLPSRFEGVPLTILEAQRMGCVVLATDVGAVAEIVTDGQDGLLVPGDAPERRIVDAMAGAIEALAADRARLRALSAAAARRAGGLRWRDSMNDVMTFLEDLLETTR